MLAIENIDHIGIRIGEKERSVSFYETLGFVLTQDKGFDQGHPIMMEHASGVVLNLLGPASEKKVENILMDVEKRYAGYTHIALKVTSLADARQFLGEKNIAITGEFSIEGMDAIFIRDPDRNVIELDGYTGQ